jgi:hypothetical protein
MILPPRPRGRDQARGTKPNRKGKSEMAIMAKFPSKFLKGDDIEAGETVTVKQVRDELVGLDQEEKPIVYFSEYDRGVILNKTNAKALVRVFGDDEAKWPGKKVA